MASKITIYHKDGTKTVIGGSYQRPSYDSTIDIPMGKQVLEAYRKLESEGKLTGTDNTRKYASFVRQVWEN